MLSSRTPEEIANEILRREGGFVNDPADSGGATNHGVTIGTMRKLGLDLDKDGDIDVNDVKQLSLYQAREIFLKEYFHRTRISDLPVILHATVFDTAVNSGPKTAIKFLQDVLNKMEFPCGAVDGWIGRKTIMSAEKAAWQAGAFLLDAYGIERRNFMFRLADRRPKDRKFCVTRAGDKGGWITRAEEFISPKYRLTTPEFQRRISKWV